MNQKLGALVRVLVDNFGPIIVFYGVNHFYGLQMAIIASTVFSIAEIILKYRRGAKVTPLFKFTAAITLLFGCVDLYAQQSILFKYESVATSLVMGVFFASSIFGGKSVIQEYYEAQKDQRPVTADRVAYFKLLTGAWVVYFALKAAAYYWVASNYSLEQSLVIRTILGTGTLYAMLFVSIFGSKKIFPFLKKHRLLPEVLPADTAEQAAPTQPQGISS
jgi:intracellular septation protein A